MNIRRIAIRTAGLFAMLALLPAYAAPNAEPEAATPVAAHWQHHALKFGYTGFTTAYTCDGLESKVKEILLHFGARKDARVNATGCAYGPDRPSRNAWVNMEFDSLATDGKEAATTDSAAAQWAAVELAPNRPFFMGSGECELVEQMKPVLTAGFMLRDVEYRTRCTPHQINLDDYHIHSQVLRAR